MTTKTTTPRRAAGPQMSGDTDGPPDLGSRSVSKPKLLLALTSGLLALLILNLALFDDLRTDASADIAGTFLAPQHLTSILACLLAVVLLAMGHRSARRVALTVAWIEIVAFLFFHGIPVEIGPSKPYWGDGMADALQWLGFALVLASSASVVKVARPPASHATRPLAAWTSRRRLAIGYRGEPARACPLHELAAHRAHCDRPPNGERKLVAIGVWVASFRDSRSGFARP